VKLEELNTLHEPNEWFGSCLAGEGRGIPDPALEFCMIQSSKPDYYK